LVQAQPAEQSVASVQRTAQAPSMHCSPALQSLALVQLADPATHAPATHCSPDWQSALALQAALHFPAIQTLPPVHPASGPQRSSFPPQRP
jgi:hypothetical protein